MFVNHIYTFEQILMQFFINYAKNIFCGVFILTPTIYCVTIIFESVSARSERMKIGGFQKTTLLDFPGHIACTVFTDGCNFRCPFCHNSPLLERLPDDELEDDGEVFKLLEKRKGILDGVAITGGEPLMQGDIFDFIEKVKSMGYAVKLDTNGTYPEKLQELLSKKLLDYVAMDIKAPLEKYALVAGTDKFNDRVKRSIEILLSCEIPYEFRTTAVKELHAKEDFEEIGKLIQGAKSYYIQCFKDSGNILEDGLSAPTKKELEEFVEIAKKYVPNAELRGVD